MGTEDSTERYYASMEHARNYHEDEYFKARPRADCIANRTLFRAGFERAFNFVWQRSVNAEDDMLRLHRELMELKYPGSVPQRSTESP